MAAVGPVGPFLLGPARSPAVRPLRQGSEELAPTRLPSLVHQFVPDLAEGGWLPPAAPTHPALFCSRRKGRSRRPLQLGTRRSAPPRVDICLHWRPLTGLGRRQSTPRPTGKCREVKATAFPRSSDSCGNSQLWLLISVKRLFRNSNVLTRLQSVFC